MQQSINIGYSDFFQKVWAWFMFYLHVKLYPIQIKCHRFVWGFFLGGGHIYVCKSQMGFHPLFQSHWHLDLFKGPCHLKMFQGHIEYCVWFFLSGCVQELWSWQRWIYFPWWIQGHCWEFSIHRLFLCPGCWSVCIDLILKFHSSTLTIKFLAPQTILFPRKICSIHNMFV